MISYVSAFVLFSALLHASWNAILHGNRDRFLSMAWMSISISIVAIVAVASLPLPAAPSWPFLLASGLIHIFYNLGLVYAYRCGDLGVTYPIARGSSPLLVALGAALVTGEHLGPIKVIGVCLVSAGIITLALQRGHFSRSGSVAALATGVMIALYTVVDGVGVRRSGDSMSYIAWTFLFYLFMPVLFLIQRNVKALQAPVRDIASSAVGGLVSIAAYGIVVWAMQFDAMVGKYVSLTAAYKSVNEALIHAGIHVRTKVNIHPVDSGQLNEDNIHILEGMDAVLVPGGFGPRGVEGKLRAIEYARTHRKPFFGICFGMQLAVTEFARNVAGWEGASSTELDADTRFPVVSLIDQVRADSASVSTAELAINGAMRLGAHKLTIETSSLLSEIYGHGEALERHRHRYEVAPSYLPDLIEAGLRVSAYSADDKRICEAVELIDHPWFIGVQFHPEFSSTPSTPNPVFRSFIEAALAHKQLNQAVRCVAVA